MSQYYTKLTFTQMAAAQDYFVGKLRGLGFEKDAADELLVVMTEGVLYAEQVNPEEDYPEAAWEDAGYNAGVAEHDEFPNIAGGMLALDEEPK